MREKARGWSLRGDAIHCGGACNTALSASRSKSPGSNYAAPDWGGYEAFSPLIFFLTNSTSDVKFCLILNSYTPLSINETARLVHQRALSPSPQGHDGSLCVCNAEALRKLVFSIQFY
jgi:hypothetical protein